MCNKRIESVGLSVKSLTRTFPRILREIREEIFAVSGWEKLLSQSLAITVKEKLIFHWNLLPIEINISSGDNELCSWINYLSHKFVAVDSTQHSTMKTFFLFTINSQFDMTVSWRKGLSGLECFLNEKCSSYQWALLWWMWNKFLICIDSFQSASLLLDVLKVILLRKHLLN